MKFLHNEGSNFRLAFPNWSQFLREKNYMSRVRRTEDEFERFRAALRIHLAVIHALMLREVKTRYGKHSFGYLWAFGEPIIYLVFWLLIHTVLAGAERYGVSAMVFLSTGIVAFFFYKDVSQFTQSGLLANKALMQFPMVKPIDVLLSRFLLESAAIIIVALVMLGTLIAMGKIPFPDNPLTCMRSAFCLLLFGFTYGCVNSVLLVILPSYAKILPPLSGIMFFSSGVFFPLSHLPGNWASILWYNPILHGVESFRVGWIPGYSTPDGSDSLLYPFICSMVLFFVGMLLERSTRIQREED